MKNGKQKLLGLFAFIFILADAGILFYCTFLNGFNPASIAETLLETALCIVAFIYVLSGFSKKFNLNYKLYFMLHAATYIIDYVFFAFDTGAAENFTQVMIGVALEFVCFGAYVLLAFAPDFGRKKSLIAAYTPPVMYALCTVYYAVSYFCGNTSGESFVYLIWSHLGYLSGCLLSVIIVYGKYTDKTLRKGPDAD